MCGFVFTNKKCDHLILDGLTKMRGPDHTERVSINGFNITHHLLDISRKKIIQPICEGNIVMVFNGEIYSPKYNVDTLNIIPLYKEYGNSFVEKINGEYAIAIIDKNKNHVFLYSDVFATKPLFYAVEGRDIGVSTYASELRSIGFTNIIRVDYSTIVSINLKDNSVLKHRHSKFNLDEYKTSMDDCIFAFENSLKLRCTDKSAVGLSSGHDSGGILNWTLKNNKVDNKFYYVITGREDDTVMSDRINKCEGKNIPYRIINYIERKNMYDVVEREYIRNKMEEIESYMEEPSTLMLSKLMRIIKRDGIDIFISGQGGDEILANNITTDDFLKNTKKQFPWENFYEGSNRFLIDQFEYIGGSYGIEVRYPYLDKNFVQEFLNLSRETKTFEYKSVISSYLKTNNISFSTTKIGMSTHE